MYESGITSLPFWSAEGFCAQGLDQRSEPVWTAYFYQYKDSRKSMYVRVFVYLKISSPASLNLTSLPLIPQFSSPTLPSPLNLMLLHPPITPQPHATSPTHHPSTSSPLIPPHLPLLLSQWALAQTKQGTHYYNMADPAVHLMELPTIEEHTVSGCGCGCVLMLV